MEKDEIIKKLIEHDEQLDRIADRLSVTATIEDVANRHDEAMTILKRLDQERIFTSEWVKRIEKEVEQHSKEIFRIKQQLKIA